MPFPSTPRGFSSLRSSDSRSGRVLGWILLALVAVAIAGTIVLQVEKQPEVSPVGHGEILAAQAGCFACHGRGDGEPRFNLRQTDKWVAKNNPTMWDNGIVESAELIDWITHGVPANKAASHRKLFIQMPAYEHRLKPEEIDAIAGWILAEGLKFTQVEAIKTPLPPAEGKLTADQLLVAGDRLSRQHGCYQCHGELGQGGVANTDSFKGYIPGFFGKDFRLLTKDGDRSEILYWIDHGRGHAVEKGLLGRLASHYFETQAIKMPGYADTLTAAEKEILTDYMLLLNSKGPLPAKEVERFVTLIDGDTSN